MASLTDTVYALASGAGRAPVAVMRLSGPASSQVVRSLTGTLPEPRRASLRVLRDPGSGEELDRALVLWLPGPGSYTGEDSAELHVHGGSAVISAVADALGSLGCRPAEPGEFSRRAFLHGRMDLTEAEGVADLIDAETSAQRRQALRQVGGALTRLYMDWTARTARLLAHQEAAIEFEMDDLPSDLGRRALAEAAVLQAEIEAHLADDRRGEKLREGVTVSITGAPNAGKSSLLNALTGQDRAIVSARAGTTRDVVECRLDLAGVPVTLADTAGLREATDEVEAEGVRRALKRAETADLVLATFACDSEPDQATLDAMREVAGIIVVATKLDLGTSPASIGGQSPIGVSVVTGAGLDELRSALQRAVVQRAGLSQAALLTRPRHRAALSDAAARLASAQTGRSAEIVAEEFRAALMALGRLTGRVDVEGVLDIVFGDFCIGK
jgi:tRNA modification GTPase